MTHRTKRAVFGFESETAFTALDEDGLRVCQDTALEEFLSLAREMRPHLSSYGSSGVFLANGARLYLDCGKPEIATPETHTPEDACRFLRACEGILADVARELTARSAYIRDILLTRCNVCYDGSGSTWGFHESYGYRTQSHSMPAQFIPHAVSRILYTGAGGFDNRSAGLEFLISPRVAHLRAAISCDTQRERGIFNTKDESLSGRGFHRLHVICGENVCRAAFSLASRRHHRPDRGHDRGKIAAESWPAIGRSAASDAGVRP